MDEARLQAEVTVQRHPDGTLRVTIEYEDGQVIGITTESVFSPAVRALLGTPGQPEEEVPQ